MPQAQPQLDVGSSYGKYFLLKKLAAGGMGEIFLAKQQGPAGFEKILVVKKILHHLTENKEFVELFLGEARLAARMNHRNIVQVFELGEQDGTYFIAMEYVSGKSLRDVVDLTTKRKEKLHAELCRTIAEQICDGASYAHNLTDITGRSLNIIHRDLNPQNVLISYTGDVKVIDFGIAKSEMSTVKTEAGMIKGKFVYMSPEQSLAKKLDKRSDIFAVGISLYEMLTGINPFHKNNIVLTLEAVQRYEPPPPSEYDPSYAPFDPIISKALAKDRDKRYSDAAEMQDDLRRIVLPRSSERLGQFMSRLFRQQLEEEQKILMDTDAARLMNAGARARTPARGATPALAEDASGGTMILGPQPVKKQATPPKPTPAAGARPAPRPPPPAPKRPLGAGDTLLDAGPVSVDDDLPGGTAMLKPGQPLPPLPSRKSAPPPRTTDTLPEVDLRPPAEGGEGKTAFLGGGPARRKPQPAPASAGTSILTPEESAQAQKEAMAKLQQAQQQAVRTRMRPQPAAPARKSGKALWIAVGGGALVAVAGLIGLVLWLLADEPAATHSPRHPAAASSGIEPSQREEAPPEKKPPPASPAPVPAPEQQQAQPPRKRHPTQEGVTPPPADKKPAPRPPEKVAGVAPPQRQAGAGKLFGTLTVNPQGAAVSFAGSPQPRQVGAYNLPVTGDGGRLEVGDSSTPYKVQLEYVRSGGTLNLKVSTSPWAIVWIDGTSRGRAPVSDVRLESKQTTLELKKPGQDQGMTVKLQYRPN